MQSILFSFQKMWKISLNQHIFNLFQASVCLFWSNVEQTGQQGINRYISELRSFVSFLEIRSACPEHYLHIVVGRVKSMGTWQRLVAFLH